MKLTGNSILITGGGTGIGLAMAKAFLERGNEVAICGRRQDKLDEACAAAPGLRAYRADVSDPTDRRELADALTRDGFEVNVLINNAACMNTYDLASAEGPDLNAAFADFQINLMAPISLIHLLLPQLRTRPDPVILNVSSPGGVVALAEVPFYCAAKAALDSYTLSLRRQLTGSGVQVITMYPPSVDTAMMQGVELRLISVETFIAELMKRLAKDKEEVWIGEGRYVPILKRIAPKLTFRFINDSTKMTR